MNRRAAMPIGRCYEDTTNWFTLLSRRIFAAKITHPSRAPEWPTRSGRFSRLMLLRLQGDGSVHRCDCRTGIFAPEPFLGLSFFAFSPKFFRACLWWAAFLFLAPGYPFFFFITKLVHLVS